MRRGFLGGWIVSRLLASLLALLLARFLRRRAASSSRLDIYILAVGGQACILLEVVMIVAREAYPSEGRSALAAWGRGDKSV